MRLQRVKRCFYGLCSVTKEDLKIFNRNLLACLHDDTGSACSLLRVARSWGLQTVKYFSHIYKLHRLEEGLKAIAYLRM